MLSKYIVIVKKTKVSTVFHIVPTKAWFFYYTNSSIYTKHTLILIEVQAPIRKIITIIDSIVLDAYTAASKPAKIVIVIL